MECNNYRAQARIKTLIMPISAYGINQEFNRDYKEDIRIQMEPRLVQFEELLGKTFIKIENDDNLVIVFHCSDGVKFRMAHDQDCCENVRVEDIVGDLDDLLNSPILMAEEVSSREHPPDFKTHDNIDDSFTWTFFKLGTFKGSVTIRWLGESNGCYSESVELYEIKKP